jgi:hypothetical protein
MKRNKLIISVLIFLGLTFIFSSCKEKIEEKKEGVVTFGANFHIINCQTTVNIFLDGESIGTLQNPVTMINDCGEAGNLTKTILVGAHTYKVEIRSTSGEDFTKDIIGTFTVSENECKKIFIDYRQIFDIDCDQKVIISEKEMENAPSDPVTIIDLEIVDDCLKIKFSASGCNGDTWIARLITDGWIINTMPATRDLRLSLDNNEPCDALITKEISFDIKNLQIEGENEIKLCFCFHDLGAIRYYY